MNPSYIDPFSVLQIKHYAYTKSEDWEEKNHTREGGQAHRNKLVDGWAAGPSRHAGDLEEDEQTADELRDESSSSSGEQD
jgi:hypothetical protein